MIYRRSDRHTATRSSLAPNHTQQLCLVVDLDTVLRLFILIEQDFSKKENVRERFHVIL